MDWEGHLGKNSSAAATSSAVSAARATTRDWRPLSSDSASRINFQGRPAEFLHQAGNQQRCWPTLQLLLETSGIEITQAVIVNGCDQSLLKVHPVFLETTKPVDCPIPLDQAVERGAMQRTLRMNLDSLLHTLYGTQSSQTLHLMSSQLLQSSSSLSANNHSSKRWDASTCVLITYADSIQDGDAPGLKTLRSLLNTHLPLISSVVHVLPFLKATSDGALPSPATTSWRSVMAPGQISMHWPKGEP